MKCSQCSARAVRGRTRCRAHLDQAAAWKREWAAAGLCHCGDPVMPDRKQCPECLVAEARRKNVKRRAKRTLGLCPAAGCERPPEPGRSLCGPHAAAQRGYVEAHRQRAKGSTT